jgi:serpin B
MNRHVVALLSAILIVSAGCTTAAPAPIEGVDLAAANVARADASPDDAARAAASINAFGFDLYRRAAPDGENVVLSPASIGLALAMARAGARGVTAAEMDAVMHGLGTDEGAQWLNALDQALASRNGSFRDSRGDQRDVTLQIANAPFAQRGMPLEPAYLDALARRFGAGLRLVDYIGDPDGARALVNRWVAQETEQRIPELLGPGTITEDARLTLVNAIYLKAPWLLPFEARATTLKSFRRGDRTAVDVPMMRGGASRPYAEGNGWRAVELPYAGDALAMTIILPDELSAFEAALTPDILAGVTSALTPRQVDLSMPRFGIETQASLAEVLAALGMPSAFDDQRADFSGITRAEQLVISAVVHQANIDVDEAGTEAAAATAVVMEATGAPADAVALVLDRPFLFLLRDVPTGAVLFLGRVADPSVER